MYAVNDCAVSPLSYEAYTQAATVDSTYIYDTPATQSANVVFEPLEATQSGTSTNYNLPATTSSPVPFETEKPVQKSFPWALVIGGAGALFLIILFILGSKRGQKSSQQPPPQKSPPDVHEQEQHPNQNDQVPMFNDQ